MHLLPVRSFWFALTRLLLGILLLAGCAQAAPTAVSPAESPTKAAVAVDAPAATIAPTALPTQRPTKTAVRPTLTPAASPTPAYPRWADLKQLSAETLATPETYKSGVLFLERGSGDGESYPLSLVLLKMDQMSFGRITPQGLTTALHHPAQGPVKMISYGTPAEEALIKALGWESVLAPELCRPPKGWPVNKGDFIPCTNYTISADGRFLAYQIPTRQSCGGQLKILNLEKRMHVISEKTGGLWSIALPSGPILYALGHCEGGRVMRFDAKSGKNDALASLPAGDLLWNPQHTAFVAKVSDEVGYQVELWGYNTENNTIFLRVRSYESNEFDDSPTWTPDGKSLLFHRQFYQATGRDTPSPDDDKFIFAHPSQIVKVDITSRSQSVLNQGLDYNLYLCDGSGASCPVTMWSGDFFPVRRAPFEVDTWTNAEYSLPQGNDDNPEVRCRLKGRDCEPPVELMGYNYKTGQIIPWSETGQPEPAVPTAEPFPSGPAPEAKAVYEDSAGGYRLVPGPQATGLLPPLSTLYLVPKEGQPVIWVESATDFIVLP